MTIKQKKILFIGCYLSTVRGTKGTAEKLAEIFSHEPDFKVILTSSEVNIIFRFFDTIKTILFSNINIAYLDIYSGLSIYYSFVYILLLRILGIPYNIILRGGGLPELKGIRALLFKRIFKKSNEIYTPSKYLKKTYESTDRRILIFPNFIDETKFFPKQNGRGSTSRKKILWVRAFTKIYNPAIPIETIRILKSKYPEIHLTMVGPDLGMLDECKLLLKKYGLEDYVSLTGKIPNDELIRLYHGADIFLNTTSIESFGMALFEAAYTGLPIISSKVGDIPFNFTHGEDILFVEEINPYEFSLNIEKLIEDEKLWERLSKGAISTASSNTLKNVKGKILDYLRKFGNESKVFLFIGSFFSKTRGTLGVSENISFYLTQLGIENHLVSKYKNKFLRILNIILAIVFRKYDFIHIDVFSGKSFRISAVAIKLIIFIKSRKRVIITLHGGALIEFYQKNEISVMKVLKSADKIFTPSIMLKSFFEKQGLEITYQPNPIDQSKFVFNPKDINRSAKNKTIKLLWIRAFSEIYNAEMAIKCVFYLKNEYGLDVNLTMVGPDLGTLSSCKLLVKELGLNQSVFFSGPISNNVLGEKYYNTHDFYVNTTDYESFGVSLMEAASCGIPIVTTNVGEIPLLWNKTELMLVEKNNHYEMGDAILFCLNNIHEVQTMVINAHQKSKNFNHTFVISQWLENCGFAVK